MKVVMIGQKCIPSRAGGVEIHVEEISTRLVEKGHEVTVYCRENYSSTKINSYKGVNLKYTKVINTKHFEAITYTFLATFDALRGKYDIYHYHALGPSLAAFIPRLFGRKVICTCHGLDWQREKWGQIAKLILKLGELIGIKFANKQIVVSKPLVNYYNNKYNKDVTYIPNGINKMEKEPCNEIMHKFLLEEDEYILFLARLVPEKGAHYLVEAYNLLETQKKLVIAGDSSHSDDYVFQLKEMAKDNQNIIFTGFVSGSILNELFTNAYLYVLPSEIEGLPISLLEAMAYNQCCLVSDIKENVEVIEEYGETFKNKSSSSLKEKLQYLIENPLQVKEYKDKSESYILNKYNWDNVAEQTETTYNNVI